MPKKASSAWRSILLFRVGSYLFLKNHNTSEGAVYHNVVNYEQLPIVRYQIT